MSKDFKKLKREWKRNGEVPTWYTTNSLQFFMNKYSYGGESVRSRDQAIADYLAAEAPSVKPDWWHTDPFTNGKSWEQVFFDAIYTYGYLIPSTPLKANGGLPERGMTVSCSGQKLNNNIASKYLNNAELAVFTKFAHGTSIDLSSWLCEGQDIGEGNVSEGVIPILEMYRDTTSQVTQGVRRGVVALYIDIEHGDTPKVLDMLHQDPEALNVGFLIGDSFIKRLQDEDVEAKNLLGRVIFTRMTRGKGYIAKKDTMNRNKAKVFKDLGLEVYASNLCCETCLPANDEYSFTCVIINANLALYDEFPEHIFHILHIMQDCNVSGYLKQIEATKQHNRDVLKKAYNFTKDFRSVGSGVCGLHSLLMQKRIVYGSLESFYLNGQIFKRMQKDVMEANRWLAKVLGSPEKLAYLGLRNATTMMMPPTKSSTELARNTPSEGIGLETALVKVKESAGGEIFRINFEFLEFMKSKGMYTPEEVARIAKNKGSCQDCTWMTEQEKAVFRTAFECPMDKHLHLCAQRQHYIDQQQSINLYFSGSDTEEYIGEIHRQALEDDMINSLYYCYSVRGGKFVRYAECENCQ